MNEPSSAAITVQAFAIKQEITEHNAEAEAVAGKEQSDCNAGTIEIENNWETYIKQEEECSIDCSEDEFILENADNEQAGVQIRQPQKEHCPTTTLSMVNITVEKELASCTDDEMFSGSETDYCQSEESSDRTYVGSSDPNRKGKKQLTPIATATPAKHGRKRKIVNVRDEKPKNRKPEELQQIVMQKMNEIEKVVDNHINPYKPPPAVMAHARTTHASTCIKQEEECSIDCSEDEFIWENADNEQAGVRIRQPQKEHCPITTLSRVNITAEKEFSSCTDDQMFSGSETDYCQSEESSDDACECAPKKAVPIRKGKKQLTPIATANPAKPGGKRKIVNVRDEKPKNRKPEELQQIVMQKMNEIEKVVDNYINPNKPPPAAMAHARSRGPSVSHASGAASLSTQLQNSRVQQDAFLRINFLNWICPVCDIDCQSNYKWRQHMDEMHQLLERENLNMEYLSNSRARCRQCCKVMPSKFCTVLKHKVTHLPHSDFLMCKLCHWRVGSMRGALLHLRREHADDTIKPPPASCPPPDASVSVKLESNVCICPFCQQSFLALTPMIAHIKSLHKSANDAKAVYLCPECGQRIQTKSRFHKHIVEEHNYDSVEKLRFVELEVACKSTAKASKCLQCGMIEPKSMPLKMREHALSHSGVKCFQCVHCELSFESSEDLRVHFCDELRQKFLFPYNLDVAHTKGKHKNPRFIRYVCPMCGEETDSKTKRSEHEESEHSMGTPEGLNFALVEGDGDDESGATYKCTVCEKKMALNVAVMYTHAVSHMPYNRWKCGRCNVPFRRLQHTYFHNCTVAVKRPSKYPTKRRTKHVYLNKYEYMMSHVCPVCNADFAHRRQWWRHLKENHALNALADMRMEAVDKRFVRCLDCNVLVRSRYTNRREHRFEHLGYKPYRCKGCAKTFNTLSAISRHIVVCSKGAKKSINRLLEGMPVRAKDQPAPPARFEHKFVKITCPICADVAFTTLPEQLAHFTLHNHFSNKYTLHANGSMNCQVCGKYFQDSDKVVMVKHQHSHFVKNCFHCLQCDFTAPTLSKLHGHIVMAHADELNRLEAEAVELPKTEDPLESADNDLVETSKTRIGLKIANSPVYSQFAKYISYACPECNEPLPTENDWQAHINSLHSFFNEEEMHQEFTIDGELVCTVCDVKVNPPAIYHQQIHKLTHMPYKSFICKLCTHRSNAIGVLIPHLRRKHFMPGQYNCEVCAQVFGTSYERYKHIKEHDPADWPPYMCRICCAVLRTKSALLGHLDTHDPNRQMFPCATCNCEYSSPRQLRRHLHECHPGAADPFEKYKCAVCEENCISSDALTAHMQRHDATEIPKTVCPICGKTFKLAKSCAVHKRSIHKPALILSNNSVANVIESTGTHCNRPKKPVLSKTETSTSTESKDERPMHKPAPITPDNSHANVKESIGKKGNSRKKPIIRKASGKTTKPKDERSVPKPAPIAPDSSKANVNESICKKGNSREKLIIRKASGKAALPCSRTESRDEVPDVEMIVSDDN